MKKIYQDIFLVIVVLLSMGTSVAQDLPLMPTDPSVSGGVLQNGMSYYIVENPTSKGLADFALVQRTGSETVPDEMSGRVIAAAKDALASLLRLGDESTQAFLARHGVAPGKDGFVKVSENATLFHFDDVVVSAGDAAVDSTLLILLDIADRGTYMSDEFLDRWYKPSDQAVIVSGDVSAAQIIERLRYMSLMTPSGESEERKAYMWQSSDESVFETSPYPDRNLVTVSATWVSPRTPKEYMNTVQPAIYEMFISELGLLAQERIRQAMRRDNIPVADISYDHLNSIRSLGDELFTMSVSVAPEFADKAVEALAEVMSSLDSGEVAVHELEMAKRRYLAMVTDRSKGQQKSNSDYVERCAAAFLYNAPLSSDKEILAFLKSRDLDSETELRLFNNVTSALLDGCLNLTVECRYGGMLEMDSSHLKEVFTSAWERGEGMVCKAPVDSLPLPGPGVKQKLHSSRPEHLSDGVLWIFENGFKVVYKRCDTEGRLHYSLALNGGYGNIRNLSKGEGAYMSDYLGLCRVSGLSGEEFRLALETEGMTMDTEVNLSNMLIKGSLPEDRPELLMGVLLALANEREMDQEEFDYYKACADVAFEYSRGNVADRISAIDSLMCPDNIYSSVKVPGVLTEDFPDKAEAFLETQMRKMNDGLLVLMGNIEETKLRKLLQLYVGGFTTTDRSFPRTVVSYQPVSGACVYTVEGNQNSADVTMSVRLPLTVENYMASSIAAEVLRQEISEAISGTGAYIRLAHNCRIYPQERFNVMVTLGEASADGFATGTELAGFEVALDRLRDVLDGLASLNITDDTLSKYKTTLKGHLALQMKTPEYWMHALSMRYLDGKDLTSGYEAKIDAVTAEKVKMILASLTEASKVEYIIRK